jgi:hypothetical protein
MKKAYEPHGSVPDITWIKTGQTRTEMVKPTLEKEKTLTMSPPFLKVGQTPAVILDSSLLALIVLLRETQIGQ